MAPSIYLQRQWTKNDCLTRLRCVSLSRADLPQFCAYFLFALVSNKSIDFASRWLGYCSNYDLIAAPEDHTLKNAEFRGHRWEQSIMTSLLYWFNDQRRIKLDISHAFLPPVYRDLHTVMKSVLKDASGRRLHIGGTKRLSGWEVFNIVPGGHVDHVGDAKDLTIFGDNSFAEIYASHILEHFGYVTHLNPLLKEWCRVLLPGGRLRISVPDLEVLSEILLDKSIGFKERFMAMRMMFGGQSNQFDFHHVGFTFEILSLYLTSNGFHKIRQVQSFGVFTDNSDKILAGRRISLNVEAYKR